MNVCRRALQASCRTRRSDARPPASGLPLRPPPSLRPLVWAHSRRGPRVSNPQMPQCGLRGQLDGHTAGEAAADPVGDVERHRTSKDKPRGTVGKSKSSHFQRDHGGASLRGKEKKIYQLNSWEPLHPGAGSPQPPALTLTVPQCSGVCLVGSRGRRQSAGRGFIRGAGNRRPLLGVRISGWGWPFPPGGPALQAAGGWQEGETSGPAARASWTPAKEPEAPAGRHLERLGTFPGTGFGGGKGPRRAPQGRTRVCRESVLTGAVSCAKSRRRLRLFPGSRELGEPGPR